MQMKMFLTALGEGFQDDRHRRPDADRPAPGRDFGPGGSARILDGVEGISIVRFTGADVVRHPLVQRIVAAYDGL
jgi:phosphate starvation-inducible PhoH-like protein